MSTPQKPTKDSSEPHRLGRGSSTSQKRTGGSSARHKPMLETSASQKPTPHKPAQVGSRSALESYLEIGKEYQALSIRDVLEARDAYHVFLMRKKNVIGTAIGKYRFRQEGVPETVAKTLENSEVRKYSWPCVMVFVKEWIHEASFGQTRGASKDDYLPRRLFLPDGREIPVCVIKAAWQQKGTDPILRMKFPGSVIGGGYPVMTKVQNEDRWATFGCLVSDGRLTYGLTNAHVAGRPGESLFTMKNGNEEEIGVSAQKQLQKKPFSEVYETFPGRHTLVNLDIGLIELNDLHGVTSQIFGLGEMKGIADVNHDTLCLKLVGCPVKGYGCASGVMKGEIVGLFYRYAAAGGYDYVADYLIGPRGEKKNHRALPFAPKKGDSGTLLVVDDPESVEHMKAIGVLWGGQKDVSGGDEQPYGLVTNLGTVCRLLDVELVCNWNTGYDVYFGAYAHVVLPSLCAGLIKDKNLKELMENNASRFSMPLGETAVKETKGLSSADFVPLADLADLVWKKRGGKYQRGREGANHFADMDEPNPKKNNRTLLDLCDDPANVDPDVWVKFYREIHAKEKGALPFRVAQIYDTMVKAVKQGNTAEFVCAAGIMSHYVFDACMPLHISYMHHGNPKGPMKTKKIGGKEKELPLAYEVHEEFDNQMVEYYSATIKARLPEIVQQKALGREPATVAAIKTAKDAAVATVALMRNTVRKYANPGDIVKDFEDLVDMSKRDRCDRLWKKYGDGLMQAMAEAVVLTTRLWEAAWRKGNGKKLIRSTDAVPEPELRRLYETKEGFLDSVNLENIKSTMTWTRA